MSDAIIRSQVYRLLGVWFSPPVDDVWAGALTDGSLKCMAPGGMLLPYALDLNEHRFQNDMSFAALAQVYSTCFEIGNATVSFHERTYTLDATNKLFEELFRYYEHFGLDLKNSDNAHWPDSILVELDFMQYLVHLESIASREEDVLSLQRGQRDFLKRHLIPLATGIADKLHTLSITPYEQLANLMIRYVDHDRDYLAGAVDDVISSAN